VWGRSVEEIVGKNTFDLGYPRDLAARIQHEVEEVIRTGKVVRNFTPFTGADGGSRTYEYIFSPILSGNGDVDAVICTARDQTDRERMERALEESKARLQQVLAQAPVAIAVFRGPDYLFELANRYYQQLLRNRELIGRRFVDTVPEIRQDVLDAFEHVMLTGEPFSATDWHVPYDDDGDGQVEDHWFNAVYHPLREADGSVSGLVAVLTDVTAQVLARKRLEQANRELEEFAYVASHDLQEPLRMIGIYSQLLVKRFGDGDERAQQYGAFVGQGVQRMERLIRDLLSYSRIVHHDEGETRSTDLNRSLAHAVETMHGRISETRATVTAAPLPSVRGDETQIALVFQNLLSNSLKYLRHDGAPEIRIAAERQGNEWVISVKDNGIGFQQQYAERIFGLFKRLHRDEYSGTGLGLAICQRIVERYGGRMWAEGRIGEGATFYIALAALEGD